MPPTVLMSLAAPTIRSLVVAAAPQEPRVIGITGPVGAGKSTLATHIAGPTGCIISTDHYLPDYDTTPQHLRDLPEHSDLARLLADLRSLRTGVDTRIPEWSFISHSRVGERIVSPRELIVVEGLHALHETHGAALDLRVYVDAPAATRWTRWEALALSGERGWSIEETRQFFDDVAEPTFSARAAHYRQAADLIVINE